MNNFQLGVIARVRSGLIEIETYLACIFSWLTPYSWYADLGIVLLIGAMSWLAADANVRKEWAKEPSANA